MEVVSRFSFSKPRFTSLIINTENYPQGTYGFRLSLRRCLVTDNFTWTTSVPKGLTSGIMIYGGQILLSSIFPQQLVCVTEESEQTCDITCDELHKIIPKMLRRVFEPKVNFDEYKNIYEFIISKTKSISCECFVELQNAIKQIVIDKRNEIVIEKNGVSTINIDTTNFMFGYLMIDIVLVRERLFDSLYVRPVSCMKNFKSAGALYKKEMIIQPKITQIITCTLSCQKIRAEIDEIIKNRTINLANLSNVIREIKTTLFHRKEYMDSFCYEITRINVISMEQFCNKQEILFNLF